MHRSLQILNKIQKKILCSNQARLQHPDRDDQPRDQIDPSNLPFVAVADGCFRGARARGEDADEEEEEKRSGTRHHHRILRAGRSLCGAVLLLDIYMKVCVCVYMRRSSMAATHQPAVLHCLLRSLAQERARRQWRGARCPGALPGQQHAWTCQCKKHIGLFRVAIAEGYHGSFSQNGLDERRFSWNKLAFFVF